MSDQIRSFIEQNHQRQTEFLAEIVKVPSDNPPGDCTPNGLRAAELLEGLGFEVERHEVPKATVEANGMISATNLIVRRKFGDGPVLAFNSHGDVVPPGEGWSEDPYGARIVDGQMYGRGVAVSKSDFATYTFALLALEAANAELNGTVELHFTYDEEAGGEIGPKWLLDEGLTKPDYAVSAAFSYGVVTAHNGCLHLEVKVTGKSAHAAMPDTGHDALEAANAVMAAIYEHRKSYDDIKSKVPGITSPSVVIGLIEGGINTNVVPDQITFRMDRRLIPEESGDQAEAELRVVIDEAAKAFPDVSVETRRILLAEPFRPVGDAERLAGIFQNHATAIMGETVETLGVPLYTDARHYSAAGIPTILYGAGPHNILEANAHRADERLRLSDLKKATEVVALAIKDILG
jgi:acetylornithine deacetylase/succinyl-diaminopimelate desuccinylase family protein